MKIKEIYIHGGIFHSDDVMCVALARIANPQVKFQRVFKAPTEVEEGVIVADIGGGKYDHHQIDAEVRPNGDKFAGTALATSSNNAMSLPDWSNPKYITICCLLPT